MRALADFETAGSCAGLGIAGAWRMMGLPTVLPLGELPISDYDIILA